MLFLRLLGVCLLLIAFMALAYDGAQLIATPARGLVLTPLSAHLQNLLPGAREAFEGFFHDYAPSFISRTVVEPMLALPASLLFAVAGAAAFLAGYRRPPPEIVSEF